MYLLIMQPKSNITDIIILETVEQKSFICNSKIIILTTKNLSHLNAFIPVYISNTISRDENEKVLSASLLIYTQTFFALIPRYNLRFLVTIGFLF